jgi:chemotaxis protein MotA
MFVIIGALIVIFSVVGGFTMGGGRLATLMHGAEVIVIVGSALGALVIMSPRKVFRDLLVGVLGTLKGQPYKKDDYRDLFKMLYELFMLGRRNGMIALEDHVTNPPASTIFNKYPSFVAHQEAINLLCGGLRPMIDGKVKPDQLKMLLDIELDSMEEERHKAVTVLAKTGDSLPGFGIVAAVLGIVITMGSIAGPIELIGQHVAAALVGTFAGILLAYGFVNPLAMKLEFNGFSQLAYMRCISMALVGFANGMPPTMALEMSRRALSEELRPTFNELEEMLKAIPLADKNAP